MGHHYDSDSSSSSHHKSCKKKRHQKKKKCYKGSLACNNSELTRQLLYPSVPPSPISVTRDQWNGIVIEGGTFQEMYYHLGYQICVDRLWQIYFQLKLFNGELSTLIGPPGIGSDRAFLRLSYTYDEILAQYDSFSDITKTAEENWLQGFNDRIAYVLLNPSLIPPEFTAIGVLPQPITLAQYIRAQYNILLTTGERALFLTNKQLFYMNRLGNLVASGKSFSDAEAIISDLYSMRRKRSYGIIAENADTLPKPCSSDCSYHSSVNTVKLLNSVNSQSFLKINEDTEEKINEEGKSIDDYLQEIEELEKERDKLGIFRMGSSYFGIEGNSTETGRPMMNGSPQTNLTTFPGVPTYGSLKNKILGFEQSGGYTFFPNLAGSGGIFKCQDYIRSFTFQVGSLPGMVPVLQPTPTSKISPPIGPNPGPNTIFYLRTDTIMVKGAPSVTEDIYVYIPVGETQPEGFVNQLALTSPPGSNFWAGTQSVVVRNLDYMKDLLAFDTFFLSLFSNSLEQYRNTLQGPGWFTLINNFLNGIDNKCGAYACETTGWYDFNTTKDIYPQGILGNPIPPKNSVVKRVGYFVRNPKTKYLANWNTAFIQNIPCIYSDGESSRVEWIEKIINDILKVRKIRFSDLENIRLLQGNGIAGATKPFTNTSQIYNSDPFHYLFKKRFLEAIDTIPANVNTILAHSLLDNFEGGFVDGDNYALINSTNISEAWILAQRWVWEVQKSIIQPTFGTAYSLFSTSSNINNSTGLAYDREVLALISRLLGTGKVPNPIFYPNWLSNTGTNHDTIIINALNTALTALGPQPWGVNRRPRVTYFDTGNVITLGPWNGNNPLIANRASNYIYGEQGKNNSINYDFVLQIGQSGVVSGPPGGPYVPVDTAQQDSYLRYEGITKPSVFPERK